MGCRYAIAVEVALAIPPGNRRVPKGSMDPIRKMGDNDFSVEHSGVRVRQRAGTLERRVKYEAEAFGEPWDYLAEEGEEA